MRLLIVNDEVLTANNMKEDVEWEKYGIREALTAYDADEAKQILSSHKIDILLCDIEMPGDNGIALLSWVREKQMEIECIYLTCHANFEYAREAVKLGCQDYILIPAKYDDIGAAVLKVVTRIRRQQEDTRLKKYGENWLADKKKEVTEKRGEKKSHREIVADSVNYIMKNLEHEDMSVNAVAAHCYLSPIYLNRIFKKEKGMSISQYIIRERMELAKKLLKDDKLTANMVAEKVGYPSYPHFSSIFKKYCGCSPSNYKETKV